MQEASSYIRRSPVSQAWTRAELDLLRTLVNARTSKERMAELFPNRTVAAVKVRLAGIRREMGVPKSDPRNSLNHRHHHITMLRPDDPGIGGTYERDWARAAEKANRAFLDALRAAA
jgi:hypothetical protein